MDRTNLDFEQQCLLENLVSLGVLQANLTPAATVIAFNQTVRARNHPATSSSGWSATETQQRCRD